MSSFQDRLIQFGSAVNNNKYLSSIKNAFIRIFPLTLIGSISVMWTNVIVNDQTGLGVFFKPIMGLSFLNPMFNAIYFFTTGSISLFLAFFLGEELGSHYEGVDKGFCGAVGLISALLVSNFTKVFGETSVSGIFSESLGATGLFSAMIMSMIGVEIFVHLFRVDALRIKLPDQVPPMIADSFAYVIPAFLDLIIIGAAGLIVKNATGEYISDLIATLIQAPLLKVGGSYGGMMIFELITVLLWAVGMHGDNILSAVETPIINALTIANMNNIAAGKAAENIWTTGFERAFFKTGGCGMVLGLTIAMLIGAKRDENRAVAKLAFVPNLFNIGEVAMFGFPTVLNPILLIPYIITPMVTGTIGYVLTRVGFCPIFAYDVPWTMPPLLIAFVAAGGSWRAVVTQIICIAVSVLIYLPFVRIYEKAQAENAVEETENEQIDTVKDGERIQLN